MDNGGTVQIQIEGIDQLKTMLASYTSIAAPIIQDAVNAGAAVLAKYTTRGVVPVEGKMEGTRAGVVVPANGATECIRKVAATGSHPHWLISK